MFRREVIKDYKVKIETAEEMVGILTTIRDHLLEQFCVYYGWGVDEAVPLLDMVLRLNKEIRHFEWLVSQQKQRTMPN
jgi:hypothetical protein